MAFRRSIVPVSKLVFSSSRPASVSAAFRTFVSKTDDDDANPPLRSGYTFNYESPVLPPRKLVSPFVLSTKGERPMWTQVGQSPPQIWRQGWDAGEDDKAMYLGVCMPGFRKEDIDVTAERARLIIKGKGDDDNDEDDELDFDVQRPELYMMDKATAEFSDDILMIVVPKVDQEVPKVVYKVTIED